jgi:hypothetical protein
MKRLIAYLAGLRAAAVLDGDDQLLATISADVGGLVALKGVQVRIGELSLNVYTYTQRIRLYSVL